MVFPFSAVFSAFGAASADYEHHFNRAVNVVVPPDPDEDEKLALGWRITEAWDDLRAQGLEQMSKEGFEAGRVMFRPLAMIRYGRQLNDLVVTSPLDRIGSASEWDGLIEAFERLYERIFARAAKYPQAGYEILEVGMVAFAEKIRPRLRSGPLGPARPPLQVRKGERAAWFEGGWEETPIYELGPLLPGNKLSGPTIVEDPTTTLVVPPGLRVRLDEYRTIWLEADR